MPYLYKYCYLILIISLAGHANNGLSNGCDTLVEILLAKEGQWVYDTGTEEESPYADDFRDFLQGKSFADYISERRRDGKSNNLLDLFGSGTACKCNNYDSLTAVRLRDDHLTLPQRKLFELDLFNFDSWSVLHKDLAKNGRAGFDIITIVPRGVWGIVFEKFYSVSFEPATLHKKPELVTSFTQTVVHFIVENGFKLLAPGGELFISLPSPYDRAILSELLKSTPGLRYEFGYAGRVLKLSK